MRCRIILLNVDVLCGPRRPYFFNGGQYIIKAFINERRAGDIDWLCLDGTFQAILRVALRWDLLNR